MELRVLSRCSRVGAAVETGGVMVLPEPTTSVTGTVVVTPSIGAVAAAVVDPPKGPELPAVVAKAGSFGGLLVVAGAGAAVVAAAAAVVESGTAGVEGRAAACCVVETGRTVGAGVAVAVAAGEGAASSCFAVVGGGVGSFVCAAPSLGRVALVAAAMGLLPVGTTVVLPASSGITAVVDVTGTVSLDTGLALGSAPCEHTLSSRTPGRQHKSHFWVSGH